MVNFHHSERKVRIAALAYAFLLSIQAMPLRAIVREVIKVRALRRIVQRVRPPPIIRLGPS